MKQITRYWKRPHNRGFRAVVCLVDSMGMETPISRKVISKLPEGARTEN